MINQPLGMRYIVQPRSAATLTVNELDHSQPSGGNGDGGPRLLDHSQPSGGNGDGGPRLLDHSQPSGGNGDGGPRLLNS